VWNGEKEKFNINTLPLRIIDKEGNKIFLGEFKTHDFVKKNEAKVLEIYCEEDADIEILEGYKLAY